MDKKELVIKPQKSLTCKEFVREANTTLAERGLNDLSSLGHQSSREKSDSQYERKKYENGNVYFGEFNDGLPHGLGTYTWFDGDTYVGDWEDGKKNGHGTHTFAGGDTYVGEFKDGKVTGHGTLVSTDGSILNGRWVDGKFKAE